MLLSADIPSTSNQVCKAISANEPATIRFNGERTALFVHAAKASGLDQQPLGAGISAFVPATA